MMKLSIDIETYSGTSINSGVYRYVEDPDFEILLFGYSVDDGPVKSNVSLQEHPTEKSQVASRLLRTRS